MMNSRTQNPTVEGPSGLSAPATPETQRIALVDSAGGLRCSLLPFTAASWAKNGRDTLQVRLDTYQGRTVVDLRNWYAGAEGELKPAKGLTVSIVHLEQLAEGVNAALAYARQHGLVERGET